MNSLYYSTLNENKIKSGIFPKNNLQDNLTLLIKDLYGYEKNIISDTITDFIDRLKENLFAYVEFPYVDRFYRNSYYNYFSTKHRNYFRDSIRISLFDRLIRYDDFRDDKNVGILKDSFLGYFIIRPTLPYLIGRSTISPKAIKNNNFYFCKVKTNVLVNGIKLDFEGFPYSAQDTESITCAETTIWIIMEYFGHKYADYRPVLPSKIISCLSRYSFERQLPSHGLRAEQISFALKEFDFGVRLYHKQEFKDHLKSIFFDYIESGIPFIATLQNEHIGHAIVVMGQEKISDSTIDSFNCVTTLSNDMTIIDSSSIPRKYLTMDDNFPPYQLANYDNPTEYYSTSPFQNCTITSLIVPLYHRIYLEAYEARGLVYYICEDIIKENFQEPIILRLFLTSSRSFKSRISLDATFSPETKDLIIEARMPKFVWIAELSTKNLFKLRKSLGLIVLDATEANNNVLDALIFIAIGNKFIKFGTDGFSYSSITLNPFNTYNNLKEV